MQILYTFVLRAGIATTFSPNVVDIPARNTKVYKTLQGYIFRILQHFATKVCNFTRFTVVAYALSGNISFFLQDKKLVYNGNRLLQYGGDEIGGDPNCAASRMGAIMLFLKTSAFCRRNQTWKPGAIRFHFSSNWAVLLSNWSQSTESTNPNIYKKRSVRILVRAKFIACQNL